MKVKSDPNVDYSAKFLLFLNQIIVTLLQKQQYSGLRSSCLSVTIMICVNKTIRQH